jgi:hypothetical protein
MPNFFICILLSAIALAGERPGYKDSSLKKNDAPSFLVAATPSGKDIDDVEYYKKVWTDGKVTYELKYEKNDEEISETWSSSGKLLEREEDIEFKSLSSLVQEKIQKYLKDKYESPKILETEKRTTEDGKNLIDVEVTHKKGPGITEVSFTEDGTYVSEEAEEVPQIETLN